jgi:hypothetical protein
MAPHYMPYNLRPSPRRKTAYVVLEPDFNAEPALADNGPRRRVWLGGSRMQRMAQYSATVF